jgi:predicted alpha-1,2-mannosidase
MGKNTWFKFMLVLFIPLILSGCNKSIRVVDLVVPTVDSKNSRWFFFNSATRPFGMVNLSPDTQVGGDWGAGYRYGVDTIKGFSHIHAWQLSGLSVMPVTITEENDKTVYKDFYSKFSHETEIIKPGYHSLILDRYGIRAELTSTLRVGFHRYQYPESTRQAVLFNLNGMLGAGMMRDGQLEKTGNREVSGSLVNSPTQRRPKDCSVFFKVNFDSDISVIEKDDATGNYLVLFGPLKNNQLLMKAAISYTSIENAGINMTSELAGWNFEKTVSESQAEWNEVLGRIEIEGGTVDQHKRFYTDFWHALQGRRIISDYNGAYPDNTGSKLKVKQIPRDANGKPICNHYNSDSFWGAQWTLNTLWGLAYPERMKDFINSFLLYYRDGGLIPRGPSGGNYTYVMVGATFTPFLVSGYQKGIRGFDVNLAYEGTRKNHMPGGIMEKCGYEHYTSLGGGFKYYFEKGYVPSPLPEGKVFGLHQDGAGQTLEYSYQDWALAQFAKALGKTDDYNYFMERSYNYKNVFDSISGLIRPKDINGKWEDPFDPYSQTGFVESNSYQATWFVPHDLPGLAQLMGGKDAAAEKLNKLFEIADSMKFSESNESMLAAPGQSRPGQGGPGAQGMPGLGGPTRNRLPINYGNQPSMQTAFIFNYFDKPWLTQFWSRRVVETVYEGITPDRGYSGDEDQGLMGSLAVLMKIGLFSMDGGCSVEPFYELGSPIFNKITIHLNDDFYPGKEVVIVAENNSPENVYIQSATLDGQVINKFKILHKQLINGCTLNLVMGDKPNKSFGIEE